MRHIYPSPKEVGIKVPHSVIEERFCAGFDHALKGGKLSSVEHLRQSFRLGFRAGKLYLKQQRKSQGIHEFPLQGRFRFRAV